MSKFLARAAIENGKGKLEFSEYTRKAFNDFLVKNVGMRIEIRAMLPESKNQRAFYHGAVVPLFAYLNDLDYRDHDTLEKVHKWLSMEFNGEVLVMQGKVKKIPQTTKGKLRDGYLEAVIDNMAEHYAIDPMVSLNPETYKKWRDEVFPFSDIDNFIDYMKKAGIIK